MERGGCVYILTNKTHSVLYTGVTSNLIGRVWQHKNKIYPKIFTAKYGCDKLIYHYMYFYIEEAIAAEKIIKGSSRDKKIKLISDINPEWRDLYDELIKE
jgi:putative endonuclease